MTVFAGQGCLLLYIHDLSHHVRLCGWQDPEGPTSRVHLAATHAVHIFASRLARSRGDYRMPLAIRDSLDAPALSERRDT